MLFKGLTNCSKQCIVVPTTLKDRFPLLRKPAFCLLVAAPPIPFERTINCTAARPADAKMSMKHPPSSCSLSLMKLLSLIRLPRLIADLGSLLY